MAINEVTEKDGVKVFKGELIVNWKFNISNREDCLRAFENIGDVNDALHDIIKGVKNIMDSFKE